MDESDLKITVNGEPRRVAHDVTVRELLLECGLNPDSVRGVAVAVNDEVVRREVWVETRISGGDRVEIVTARQGG